MHYALSDKGIALISIFNAQQCDFVLFSHLTLVYSVLFSVISMLQTLYPQLFTLLALLSCAIVLVDSFSESFRSSSGFSPSRVSDDHSFSLF